MQTTQAEFDNRALSFQHTCTGQTGNCGSVHDRPRPIAKNCNFGKLENELVIDRLVCSTN